MFVYTSQWPTQKVLKRCPTKPWPSVLYNVRQACMALGFDVQFVICGHNLHMMQVLPGFGSRTQAWQGFHRKLCPIPIPCKTWRAVLPSFALPVLPQPQTSRSSQKYIRWRSRKVLCIFHSVLLPFFSSWWLPKIYYKNINTIQSCRPSTGYRTWTRKCVEGNCKINAD